MRRCLILFALVLTSLSLRAQGTSKNPWNELAKTKFESKYHEKIGEYMFHPNFPPEIKAMVGKELTIEGYYVPFSPEEGTYIVISKFPMSQCYFCGGGGPESVVEVNFAKNPGKFQVDDLITVTGKLRLNTEDLDHLFFILDQATLVSK